MLLHVKIFEEFWMESNISFFTKIFACFGAFGTSLVCFGNPVAFIIVTNSCKDPFLLSWCRNNIR